MSVSEIPHPARISRRAVLLASAGALVPAAARSAPVDLIVPEVAIPETAAGRQLAWVLEQVRRKAGKAGKR